MLVRTSLSIYDVLIAFFGGLTGIEQLETLPLRDVAREVVSRLAVLLDGAGVERDARGEVG